MQKISSPRGCVCVEGLKVFAHHGVDPQETLVGNRFEVSVSLFFDSEHAMRSDRVDLTVNYAELIDLIKEEMAFPSKLLEHVAYRIYNKIGVKFPSVTGGRLCIYKLQPPVSAELDRAGFCFEW